MANVLAMKLCLLICSLLSIAASAQLYANEGQTTDVYVSKERQYLGLHTLYLEDSTGDLTIADALKGFRKKQFEKSPQSLQFGYRRTPIWIAFFVNNSTNETVTQLLEIRYGPLDELEVYQASYPKTLGDEKAQLVEFNEPIKLGDFNAFESRPVDNRNYILPLSFEAKTRTLFMVRVKTTSSFSIPLFLSSEKAIFEHEHLNQLWLGLFYGVSLGLFFYNLFLFFSTRQIVYFQYICYVGGYTLFMASLDGLLYRFWPNSPDWESRSLYIFAWGGFTFLLPFCRTILRTRDEAPKLDYVLLGLMFFYIVGTVSFFFIDDIFIISRLNAPSVLITALILLVVMFVRFIQGSKEAAYTLVGMSCFFIGMLAVAGGTLNLHQHYQIAPWIFKAGSSIEMILFSIVLANKINSLEIGRLKAEAAATSYLEKYQYLYENAVEGQFQFDQAGTLLRSNSSWREIAGYEDESELAKNSYGFQELLSPQDWRALLATLSKNSKVSNYKIHIKPFDGQSAKVLNLSIRLDSDSSDWVGSAIDVTESEHHEQNLKRLQHERTHSLKQLVTGVSHEMNTPLGNVKVAHSILKDSYDTNALTPEDVEAFTEAAKIIDTGVDKLEELAQLMRQSIVSNREYPVESIDIYEWIVGWKARQKNLHPDLEIEMTVDTELSNWITYPEALEKVLNQLVQNSVDHNEKRYKNEKLEVSIACKPREERGARSLVLEYSDNGIGIDTENPGKIFEPFFTTRRQYAKEKGLGMYITYNLITEILHGDVEWKIEEGTSGFNIHLVFPELGPNQGKATH